MNTLTILVLAGLLLWWFKPLRVFLVERTNRTVKVLLIVFPLLFAGRVAYNLYTGQQDDMLTAALLLVALVAVWLGLVWLGNVLERRKPTQVKGPDLAMLSRLPGVPRVPGALTNPAVRNAVHSAASNPEVQRVARTAGESMMRAAVQSAVQVDRKDVAGSIGRMSGKWAARMRKSMASDGK